MTTAPRTELKQNYGNHAKSVAIESVTHFTADCKYVSARHPHGELLLDDTLTKLEAEFGDRFVRIHRNTLVARSMIRSMKWSQAIKSDVVIVEGVAEPLRVARRQKLVVRDAMINAGGQQ
jgi:two-component system response regulator AlgR